MIEENQLLKLSIKFLLISTYFVKDCSTKTKFHNTFHSHFFAVLNPLTTYVPYRIETSQLIWTTEPFLYDEEHLSLLI